VLLVTLYTLLVLKKSMSEVDWVVQLIMLDNHSTDCTAYVANSWKQLFSSKTLIIYVRLHKAGAAVAR